MAKGTQLAGKPDTNVKGPNGLVIEHMKAGDYVFGTLNTAQTSIMNFDHFYRATGARVELGKLCTAVTMYMVVDPNAVENPPPPPVGPVLTHIVDIFNDGSLKVDGNPIP